MYSNVDLGCRQFGGFDDHLLEVNFDEKRVPNQLASNFLSSVSDNIIGNYMQFSSPYGEKPLVYADWTASGRGLHQVENYILSNILPYYGNTVNSLPL